MLAQVWRAESQGGPARQLPCLQRRSVQGTPGSWLGFRENPIQRRAIDAEQRLAFIAVRLLAFHAAQTLAFAASATGS